MTGRASWALRWAMALHGASMLLDPLLLFRACSAGLDSELGYLLAVLAPAAAALGAAATRPRVASVPALARRASLLSLWAVGARVLGALLVAWLAQSTSSKEALPIWLGPALGLVWVGAFAATGGAVAIAFRIGFAKVGRVGYAEVAGAAAGALAIPALMALGVPRALVAAAILPAAAAVALSLLCRRDAESPAVERSPTGSVLVTSPLVLAVLIAGDIGSPWLKIPAQNARRATGGTLLWTAEGLVAAPKPSPRQIGYWIDDSPLIPLASVRPGAPKPPATPGDLAFGIGDAGKGAALVVGSGGGAEVRAALLAGHGPVHAVELHPTVVRGLALGALGEDTGYFYAGAGQPADRLRVWVGDGRSSLPNVDGGYARIVVVGAEPFVPAAPRLLAWTERAYTREALVTWIDRLAEGGVLGLVRPVNQLPALVATARGALGLTPEDSRQHLVACSAKESALVLVRREAWSGGELQRVAKLCRKRRMVVHDLGAGPLRSDGNGGDGDADEPSAPVPNVPIVATDDRPFFGPLVPFADLPAVIARDLARAFVVPEHSGSSAGEIVGLAASAASDPAAAPTTTPSANAGPVATGAPGVPAPSRPSTRPAPPKADPAAASESASTEAVRGTGILWATAIAALLLVGLAAALSRSSRSARVAVPTADALAAARVRWALLPLGLGLGWAELGTTELAVRLLGHSIHGWGVAIPVSLAALGAGRLLVDALSVRQLRRALDLLFGLGVLVLVVLFAAGFRAGALAAGPASAAALLALAALTTEGLVLGAAFSALLRTLVTSAGARSPAQSLGLGAGWAAHTGGWALGAATGALVARHVGTQTLLLLGASAVLVAAVVAGRPRPASLAAEAAL